MREAVLWNLSLRTPAKQSWPDQTRCDCGFCQLQKLPDWIDGQVRALAFFGGVSKAIVCDNLKAGVANALWFEPTLNTTFAAMAEHYDTTMLSTRSRTPPAGDRRTARGVEQPAIRHVVKSRRELFKEIERATLRRLPATPFEYAEWISAKVHPDYHVEIDKTFYSLPHRLIGRTVQVRLTH